VKFPFNTIFFSPPCLAQLFVLLDDPNLEGFDKADYEQDSSSSDENKDEEVDKVISHRLSPAAAGYEFQIVWKG